MGEVVEAVSVSNILLMQDIQILIQFVNSDIKHVLILEQIVTSDEIKQYFGLKKEKILNQKI